MDFIDLYAGVGGFRLGFERQGHNCIWSCEKDKYCRQVYRKQWGEPEASDVKDIQRGELPDFDLLCAGFPCQSFSLAGKRKGFKDTRGTLFHEIGKIIRVKTPEYLLLENVKGLLSTQSREAFRIVLQSLDKCGYNVSWQVLNSKNFGVPQNRPRVFIVGHLRAEGGSPFKILPFTESNKEYEEAYEETQRKESRVRGEISGTIDKNYYKGGGSRTHIKEGERKVKKEIDANFQKSVYDVNGISPTVREGHGDVIRIFDNPTGTKTLHKNVPEIGEANRLYHPDGKSPPVKNHDIKILDDEEKIILHNAFPGKTREYKEYSPSIQTPKGGGHLPSVKESEAKIRKLTPIECERLQGFPDNWTKYGLNEDGEKVDISDTQRYKMMGNAVTVNVVEYLAYRFSMVENEVE